MPRLRSQASRRISRTRRAVPPPPTPRSAPLGLLAAAIEAMPAFAIRDPSGRLIYANTSYEELARRQEAADPSAPLARLIPIGEVAAELVPGGTAVIREIALADASVPTLRVRHVGIHEGERLMAIAAWWEEIGELRAARHKLSLTHERLEDITRLSSDWIWETDTNLAITFASPRVATVLGFQPVELIGRSLLTIGDFPGELRDGAHPLDPRRRQPFRDLPVTMLRRDGGHRLCRVSALPVFCPTSGDFLGFRGTVRDVTDEADALKQARQWQEQLGQAIESISEGFALFDPQDRLVLCNAKFRNLFPGVEHLLVPGARFADLVRAVVARGDVHIPIDQQERWIAERLKSRAESRTSIEVELSDGRWLKVSDHKTADGSTVGIRSDITQSKQREEALFAAKEAAEIANRSKSEFLANISHELRTPLNAIIGFSEIMREEIFGPLGSPQYVEYTGDVLDSAHHLLEVINDILDIAKAEAGKLELCEDDVDMTRVVRAAARLVHERAQRGEIKLIERLPPGLPAVRADERKLKQILLNLLTNSVKFTRPGGQIEVAARVEKSGEFLLTVEDTGIGIAPQDIATALAPFGQVDSRLNRKYEGTGLGLPLCNAMIKLHGGSLAIDSTPGTGTIVSVRLPASRIRLARRKQPVG